MPWLFIASSMWCQLRWRWGNIEWGVWCWVCCHTGWDGARSVDCRVMAIRVVAGRRLRSRGENDAHRSQCVGVTVGWWQIRGGVTKVGMSTKVLTCFAQGIVGSTLLGLWLIGAELRPQEWHLDGCLMGVDIAGDVVLGLAVRTQHCIIVCHCGHGDVMCSSTSLAMWCRQRLGWQGMFMWAAIHNGSVNDTPMP